MNAPRHIIIHHSLTDDSRTLSFDAIRRFHTAPPPEGHGWRDIGYHFVIEQVGDRYHMLAGRPLHVGGAHTVGMNQKSVGVCLVGNFDDAAPSPALLKFAAYQVGGLCAALNITTSREYIHPHSEYAPKSCPGTQFPFGDFVVMCGYYKHNPGDWVATDA